MDLFNCHKQRKPRRANSRPRRLDISRPLEGSQSNFRDKFHANPNHPGEDLRKRREAESKRKADKQRQEREQCECKAHKKLRVVNTSYYGERRSPSKQPRNPQWVGTVYSVNDYPTMQEIEDHERYGPRGRDERYVRTHEPPLDDRWRGAYDQLTSKSTTKPASPPSTRSTHRSRDLWGSDAGMSRPEPRKAAPQVQIKHPQILTPGHAPQQPVSSRRHMPHLARSMNTAGIEDSDIEYSSILRSAKIKPAPKEGKRVLYNEDAATATRRNMGF